MTEPEYIGVMNSTVFAMNRYWWILVEVWPTQVHENITRYVQWCRMIVYWNIVYCHRNQQYHCNEYSDRKLKKTDALSPEHSDLSNNLRLNNSILKRNIRLTKTDYYAEKFEKYKLNIRRTWSTINEALNKSEKKDYFPNYFIVDGNKTNCKTNIANSFNSFLANIGKNLSDKIHCDTRNTINTYLKQNIISSFAFECVLVNDVLKIISDLAPKNSCGIDHISSKLLKRINIIIAAPLAHIVNQSLCTGIFPDRLKIA